ncbi:MAG TPA: phosphotransferase [Acidimicrobiia bacterium]|nr:phosphotransferase [Acidimicrobiia bacterium]
MTEDRIRMQYAPLPTEEQLERVRQAIGASSLVHRTRLEAGIGCTMDVLSDRGHQLVLRRYGPWAEGSDTPHRETRALELMQRANIPAPAPIWVDSDGIFENQAIIISFVEGEPDLTPANPFDWAEQLASVLARIHDIRLEGDDVELFPPGAGQDIAALQDSPELILEHPLGEELLRRRVLLAQRDIPSEPVFSHTDFWPGNTLWNDGQLAAVIDWESPATGDREMDVAYCSLDIRYLGMDRVADHFIKSYREVTGQSLPNLGHWESVGLCRPMPDIAKWVDAWVALGRDISKDRARARYTEVLEDFLERTG